jgi:aspartyl-tRNA(Asn)/glutamyl-tRNA(Gln) amidotransferase subunit B
MQKILRLIISLFYLRIWNEYSYVRFTTYKKIKNKKQIKNSYKLKNIINMTFNSDFHNNSRNNNWEMTIGLEIHAQIKSQSKLFSGASTQFGAAPNSHVSFVDAAMPGMLPVLNIECVRKAVMTGLGIGAKINLTSFFDRKNYFYPDLPQGYQISQFAVPIAENGHLDIKVAATDGGELKTTRVDIVRIHMEQDAGKIIHDQSPSSSYVDLNRCGVALMEIVTGPSMHSAEEAAEFLKEA